LTRPMLKQGGQWHEVDWQTALEYLGHGLADIQREHGSDGIAALATPHATLEELYLLQKLVRGLGSSNVDFRLRQSDFSNQLKGAPWLGMAIADVERLDTAFVIGSFLRKDHPLLAARLRHAVKNGGKLSVLHACDDDPLIPLTGKIIAAPGAWTSELAGVAAAVAAAKDVALPSALSDAEPSQRARQIAEALLSGEHRAVLLGNSAVQHPQFAQLHALAQWIAEATGAKLGFLTEAANTVGGYLTRAVSPLGTKELVEKPRQAYLLLHAEPEFDSADPATVLKALRGAKMVAVLSPYKNTAALDYADVLLPVAPFTETAGTFVNCEGTAQSFNGVVRPLGETRPAWKVLRVLGNLLKLPGFEYETPEQVRDEVLSAVDMSAALNNATTAPVGATAAESNGLERIADVPIYHADALVRRAPSLHLTNDARRAMVASLPADLFDSLGVNEGDAVTVRQGECVTTLPAARDAALPSNTVRVSSATPAGAALGPMFGQIKVEKAQ
ncbi:MAG: molybdopterin-dependent oxidoreductase, partial [Burkholderiales bacterium]|nr:molybdopterin-dependent oxidoreductase [Burkholderiales bacterium]